MIKRPLDPRFSEAVKTGRKFTTIRANGWPFGVPVMLYNWSGKPYRSKQIDVAAVVVDGAASIDIAQSMDGKMSYVCCMWRSKPIHESEGFDSLAEMDDWFRKLVKPGCEIRQTLMRFKLMKD